MVDWYYVICTQYAGTAMPSFVPWLFVNSVDNQMTSGHVHSSIHCLIYDIKLLTLRFSNQILDYTIKCKHQIYSEKSVLISFLIYTTS